MGGCAGSTNTGGEERKQGNIQTLKEGQPSTQPSDPVPIAKNNLKGGNGVNNQRGQQDME